ncbi:hypothetical protein ACTXT7_014401 [Hymenolepis weldensis]
MFRPRYPIPRTLRPQIVPVRFIRTGPIPEDINFQKLMRRLFLPLTEYYTQNIFFTHLRTLSTIH